MQAGKRILITGGAGFIGSHLIELLVKKYPKIKIISVDNYFTGKKENHINHKNVKNGQAVNQEKPNTAQ